jgi:hypothetical protein
MYFKFVSPFVDHIEKPYLWHSARLTNLPNFRHKCRYIRNLKNVALEQEDPIIRSQLLNVCIDIAIDLKISVKEEKREAAKILQKEMLEVFHREKYEVS